MRNLLAVARARIDRNAALQTTGFAGLALAAGHTFGLGALLAATGISCLILSWLTEPATSDQR